MKLEWINIWDQVNDPKCECGRLDTIVHKWKSCSRAMGTREKLCEMVGSNLMYISHPFDILALASNVKDMENIIKAVLNTAFDFKLVKRRYFIR